MKKSIASQIGILVGIFVLLISIPFGVYLATQQERATTLKSRASNNSPGSSGVYMYLWPATTDLTVCSLLNQSDCPKTKIEVIVNTGGGKISGTDISLSYDPNKVGIVNDRIYPGVVDNNMDDMYRIFNYYRDGMVDKNTGKITIKSRGEFTGERGVVATFFITGRAVGEANILFNGAFAAYDESGTNNVLLDTSGLTVNVK